MVEQGRAVHQAGHGAAQLVEALPLGTGGGERGGLATRRLADAAVYARVDAAASVIADALEEALGDAGVTAVVPRAGNLFGVAFRRSAPATYAEAQDQDASRYTPFFHAMLDQGVMLPPSVYEAWFLTAAHGDAEVERIVAALPTAARAAAR